MRLPLSGEAKKPDEIDFTSKGSEPFIVRRCVIVTLCVDRKVAPADHIEGLSIGLHSGAEAKCQLAGRQLREKHANDA